MMTTTLRATKIHRESAKRARDDTGPSISLFKVPILKRMPFVSLIRLAVHFMYLLEGSET